MIGRVFTNDEDKPGAAPVVVLSYALWQRRFGGQNSILNQALTLNGRSYTVIGVMPAEYAFPSRVEMWVPVGQLSGDPNWQQRGNHPGLYGVGRLKPGATMAQAQADMNTIAANLEKQFPDSNTRNGVRIRSLMEVLVGSTVRSTLWVLFGAVAFVLLIACANIANLLLARATSRRKEMAIRAAMGAGRWRIARQLLTESLLLAIIGGGIGLGIAVLMIKWILYVSPTAIPRSREIALDWRVLGFTLAVSFLTGILFGLVPALQAGEVDVHETLKEAGRGTSAKHWLRSSLVIVEVATTMVLLIGAGLMIRSFYRLQNVNPGFSYEQLTSFTVALPQRKYVTEDQRAAFFNTLLQNLRTVPGVQSVGQHPAALGNNGWQTSFVVDGRPQPPRGQTPLMEACTVTPDYFRAMNIPLLRGRYFTDQDNRAFIADRDLSKLNEGERLIAGANVIIVDDLFAKQHWQTKKRLASASALGATHKLPCSK
jgi:putative ABC transport system permease protein